MPESLHPNIRHFISIVATTHPKEHQDHMDACLAAELQAQDRINQDGHGLALSIFYLAQPQ
jgi:hypothetical protein